MCERELKTEQNCNILTPTYSHNSVSFPFSWAAQPASSLQLIELPVHRVIQLFNAHLLFVGITNHTHSNRLRLWSYSDISRQDAPVVCSGAFPILTARPGRMSIYNRGLCNAKAILAEEQWHYLTNTQRKKRFHIFFTGISQKVNVIAWLKRKLSYFEISVKCLCHYTIRSPPSILRHEK